MYIRNLLYYILVGVIAFIFGLGGYIEEESLFLGIFIFCYVFGVLSIVYLVAKAIGDL